MAMINCHDTQLWPIDFSHPKEGDMQTSMCRPRGRSAPQLCTGLSWSLGSPGTPGTNLPPHKYLLHKPPRWNASCAVDIALTQLYTTFTFTLSLSLSIARLLSKATYKGRGREQSEQSIKIGVASKIQGHDLSMLYSWLRSDSEIKHNLTLLCCFFCTVCL